MQPLRAATLACCLALSGCSSCFDVLDCSGDYLFQDWVETSYAADGGSAVSTVADDGGTPIILDLTRGHFGPGQGFYLGGCQFAVDIEADDSGAAGTFAFSHPNPDSPGCIALETTQTWTLSCRQLVVVSPNGTATYTINDNLPVTDGDRAPIR